MNEHLITLKSGQKIRGKITLCYVDLGLVFPPVEISGANIETIENIEPESEDHPVSSILYCLTTIAVISGIVTLVSWSLLTFGHY